MKAIVILFFLFSSVGIAQSGYVGFKVETGTYLEKRFFDGSVSAEMAPGLYCKLNLFYDKFEFELRGGYQLHDEFGGPEYGFALKYNAGHKVYPLITYLNHYTSSDGSHNSGGAATGAKEFIGAGIELRFTKVFGFDLIYYHPVGDDALSYYWEWQQWNEGPPPDRIKRYTRILGMFKLGFIFNIGAPKLTH